MGIPLSLYQVQTVIHGKPVLSDVWASGPVEAAARAGDTQGVTQEQIKSARGSNQHRTSAGPTHGQTQARSTDNAVEVAPGGAPKPSTVPAGH
jgi:hypothetical protein